MRTNGKYLWSIVTQILCICQPNINSMTYLTNRNTWLSSFRVSSKCLGIIYIYFSSNVHEYQSAFLLVCIIRRVIRRYPRGNHNPYMEEEQTKQWPKEKVLKDKQRSTKHTHKTKHRVTRTPLNPGGEFRPRKGKQLLSHQWYPSCYACENFAGES